MDVSAAQQAIAPLRAAHLSDGPLTLRQRRALLRRLQRALGARRDDLIAAVTADTRGRSAHEVFNDELWICHQLAATARKHLKEWMLPEPVELPALPFRPGRARVTYQPLGVVGIIAARSAPVRAALSPLISAIAAGNRVIVKPSEHTPATAALLSSLLTDALGDTVVAVLAGGPAQGEALCRAGLDHLHVTGAAATGRAALAAASETLTPVTLSVGGKSLALIHPSYPIATAARRIMRGKLASAGQSCAAPDVVWCPADKVDALVSACADSALRQFPTLADNDDYAAIVDDQHRWRLSSWVDEAVSAGATRHALHPADEDLGDGPKMAPVALTGVPSDASLCREEIFGPVLVVAPYTELSEAIASIASGPVPPRLYYFDHSARRARALAARAPARRLIVNYSEVHAILPLLPGGFAGFEAFSRRVPIYEVRRLSLLPALHRPLWARLVGRLRRLLLR